MGEAAIKPLLTTRDLAAMTGLSMDYFQRLARAGEIPCQRLGYGSRAMFLFDSAEFEQWWENNLRRVEPCPKARSARGGRSGTAASGTKASKKNEALKQTARQLLANVLAGGSEN